MTFRFEIFFRCFLEPILLLHSDQNMIKPQMRNSYELRLVQVSLYSGQAVINIILQFLMIKKEIPFSITLARATFTNAEPVYSD